MSLINCPECGHECASSAVSCPNCGHPFVKPVIQPRVVVREIPREDSFPKWIFAPIAIVGLIILFVVFVLLRKDEDPNQRNINVSVAASKTPERIQTTTSVPTTSQPSTITVPTTSQPSTITVPQTAPPPSTVTTVPATSSTTVTAPAPDKGSVEMEAKVLSKSGPAQPVSRTKFYLLDKDIDSILSEARIEDETGQGLSNALGMSVANPGKYQDFNQKAFAAIKKHIVYSTTTDGSGKAKMPDVKPKSYYLFAVAPTKNGFALWNSPVTINVGQNSLMLEPIAPTEIVDDNQ